MKVAANVGRAYIGVLIIGVLIAAGAFGLWYIGSRADKQVPGELAAVPQTHFTETDSDNDGLADWEEVLWKTDPENLDTDRDGTRDGDEVAANRDPLKPGPKDTLQKAAADTPKPQADSLQSFTTIDMLAKGLLDNYQTLSSDGIPDQIKTGLQGSIIGQVEDKAAIKKYSVANLAIQNTTDDRAVQVYAETLRILFSKYNYYSDQDEPALLKTLLSTRSEEDEKKLASSAAVYKKISDEMLTMPVPLSAVSFHLTMLNSFYGMYQSVNQMSAALSDPLMAMIGLKNGTFYNEVINAQFAVIESAMNKI